MIFIRFSDPEFKQCVKKPFVEKAADELEDDNPSNALDEDKDDDDSGSGSGEETPNPLEGKPPKGKPNTSSKNPIKDDNNWEPPPPQTPEDENDEDDEGSDDGDEKEEEAKKAEEEKKKKEEKEEKKKEKKVKKKQENEKKKENALDSVDPGIAVQKPPASKAKGSNNKDKSKGKSS